MIRHIVMWKLKEFSTEAEKQSVISTIKSKLMSLKGKVPSLKAIEVGSNAPEAAPTNWDVALVTDFETIEGLNEYQVHPEHVKVATYIREQVASRSCVDYEL